MALVPNSRNRMAMAVGLGAILRLAAGTPARADPQGEFFENRIRPVLVEYCYECHSSATAKPKASLRLDSRDATRTGGDSGPAVVPGKADESLLIDAIRHDSLEMPPGKKLPQHVIDDFVKWIESGAIDPRDVPPAADSAAQLAWEIAFARRRSWWSLQPLVPRSQPLGPDAPGAHAAQAIDRFIQKALRTAGLSAAPPAESQVLLRRLSFVLTGLPPTAAQVGLFAGRFDSIPAEAVAALADEILASPHFGEQFARHWMDVIRYGDTHGYEWDPPAKGAWRYRDYLIRAFNDDVGFDQLVREQIAGDLLPQRRINQPEQLDESLIGPMFFHLGEHRHLDSLQFNGVHQDMINNKIDAFSKAFLATTVACAKCHDHKLDAVSQRDYYALASVFMTPRWAAREVDRPERHARTITSLKELRGQIGHALAGIWSEQATHFSSDLKQAFASSPAIAVAEAPTPNSRTDVWRCAFPKPEAEKAPALDNIADMGRLLHAALSTGELISTNWNKLTDDYKRLHADNHDFNTAKFRPLADFRSSELPAGWTTEGDGIRHGYVDEGTPLIALEGSAVAQRLLHRGYHTHALSTKLAGAVRTSRLQSIDGRFVSLELAGGGGSGVHIVPVNAFLSDKLDLLTAVPSKWKRLDTNRDIKPIEWTVWSEVVTAALNANFPPPHYRARAQGLTDVSWSELTDMNGWFSLTGIVAHDKAEAPKATLNHWQGLFSRPVPETVDDACQAIGDWLAAAVERWCRGQTADGDVELINWLLEHRLLGNELATSQSLEALVGRYRELERSIELPRSVNSMDERGMPAEAYVLDVRGNVDDPGEAVAHDFLQVFAGQNDVAKSPHSGRLELAGFLVSPQNPLTARVYVNRVWQWVFGAGLVSTPDDFGHLGDKPSHPELLDWLASEFMAQGWSTKWLVRQLVLSATFRQGSVVSEKALQVDPENRLLHHYPTRRLEAESVRDSILAVSGRLDRQLFGPPIDPPRNSEDPTKRLFSGPLDGNGRRSIYTKITLMEPPKFLTNFNFPDPKIPTGKRDVTNVPTQALALLNSPFVIAQAEYWAQQLVQERQASPAERLRAMCVRALGREPTVEDLERWCLAVEDFRVRQGIPESQVMLTPDIWTQVAHALFITKEFIYYR